MGPMKKHYPAHGDASYEGGTIRSVEVKGQPGRKSVLSVEEQRDIASLLKRGDIIRLIFFVFFEDEYVQLERVAHVAEKTEGYSPSVELRIPVQASDALTLVLPSRPAKGAPVLLHGVAPPSDQAASLAALILKEQDETLSPFSTNTWGSAVYMHDARHAELIQCLSDELSLEPFPKKHRWPSVVPINPQLTAIATRLRMWLNMMQDFGNQPAQREPNTLLACVLAQSFVDEAIELKLSSTHSADAVGHFRRLRASGVERETALEEVVGATGKRDGTSGSKGDGLRQAANEDARASIDKEAHVSSVATQIDSKSSGPQARSIASQIYRRPSLLRLSQA